MVRINLLPVRVSKKKEAGKQQIVLFGVLLVLGVVSNYVWASTRAATLASRRAAVARTQAEIAQLDRIIGEVKNIKDQQAQLREKLEVLGRLKAGRVGPVRLLDELAMLTPKRLWINKVDEKGGSITFEGCAATIDDVSEFMTALKGSKQFHTIELKRTSAKTDKRGRLVDFTLTAVAAYARPPAAAPSAKKG